MVAFRKWFACHPFWADRTTSYAVAILSTMGVFIIRLALDPLLDDRYPITPFFFAVALSAWYGGWKPGLLSLVLGVVLASFFFINPRGTFIVEPVEHRFGAVLYILASGGVVALLESLRSSSRREASKALETRRVLEELSLVKQAAVADRANSELLAEMAITNAKLDAITHSVPEVLYMVAPDGKLLWWNANAKTVTGLDDHAMGNMNVLQFFPESAVPHVSAAIQHAYATGFSTVTAPLRTSKGLILYEFNAVPVRDRAGKVLGVVGAGRDIAEHVALVESLRQAKEAAEAANRAKKEQLEELELVYQMAPVGLALIDRDFRNIRVNEKLAAISGLPVSEQVGHTLREVIPRAAAELEAVVHRVFSSGEPVLNLERTLAPPSDSGNERNWLESYYPVGSVGGTPRYVGFVLQDMTEIKKVEFELRRVASERFAHATLDALSAHIAILDEKGNIIATNKVWRDFAVANGAQSDVGIGASYLDACDNAVGPCGQEASPVAAGIRAVIRGERAEFSLEYPCHSPTERRWYLARATRFAGDGPIRVVVSHENITAAKVADEEREKFVSLVENAVDAIGLATLSTQVIYLNPAARGLLGLAPLIPEMANQVADLLTEAGKAVFRANLPIVMATGRWAGEVQFQNARTGQAIDTDASVFIVRHPKTAEPICITTVARDITQRKKQDAELRSKTAFLEAQTEASLDGLRVVDDQQNRLLQNRQYVDIWQPPKELIDDPRHDAMLRFIMNLTTDPAAFLARAQYLYAHQDETGREEIALKDGRVIDRYSAPVNGSDGHYYGRIGSFRDITERKQREAELRLIGVPRSTDGSIARWHSGRR